MRLRALLLVLLLLLLILLYCHCCAFSRKGQDHYRYEPREYIYIHDTYDRIYYIYTYGHNKYVFTFMPTSLMVREHCKNQRLLTHIIDPIASSSIKWFVLNCISFTNKLFTFTQVENSSGLWFKNLMKITYLIDVLKIHK